MSDFNHETNFSHTPKQSASFKKGGLTVKKDGDDLIFIRKTQGIGCGGTLILFGITIFALFFSEIDPGCYIFLTPVFLFILLLFYSVIVCLVNKTKTRISKELITIKTGPLPFKPTIYIPSKSVTQIYYKSDKVEYGKEHYSIIAILENGEEILIEECRNIQDAELIEEGIELFLGIENKEVAGEYREYFKANVK